MPIVHLTAPVRVVAAAADDPAVGDPAGSSDAAPRRTIEGVAVPYGVEGTASDGVTYVFRPGSLTLARERLPVLFGHDRQRPAGVLRELRDSDAGPVAVIAVDETPDGDLALAQAASGSRAGLSVGADPTLFTVLDSGVVDVEAARLVELSLVAIPAYDGAQVTTIHANAREGDAMPDTTTPAVADVGGGSGAVTTPAAHVGVEANGAGVSADAGNGAATVRIEAGARGLVVGAERRPVMTADQYVGALLRAANGDTTARGLIEAAVGPASLVADNPGVLPPTITNQLLGELPDDRPLVSVCATRPLPAAGMEISKPIWVTHPNGGWMASDAAVPATNTPAIGLHNAPVEQWAYAFATSQAVAQRSSPDFIEAVYRNAVIDYHRDVEARLAALLVAAAPPAVGQTIGGAFAAVYAACGRVADLLVVAVDVFGELLDAQGQQRFSTGSASASGGIRGNIYGLNVVVGGALALGTAMVGCSNAIDFRESTPIRLSANVIGAMQVELGITSFALFDVEVTNAFAAVDAATITPAATGGATSRSRRSE